MLASLQSNWAMLLDSIPLDVKRTHRGRRPAEGLDCVGLVFWAYREMDRSIDHMDIDYPGDGEPLLRHGYIETACEAEPTLANVTPRVAAGFDKDGDIWVLRIQDGLRHIGIQAAGRFWHMGQKLHVQNADRVRAWVRRAYRSNSPLRGGLKETLIR